MKHTDELLAQYFERRQKEAQADIEKATMGAA